jgi:TatD DNase family protein
MDDPAKAVSEMERLNAYVLSVTTIPRAFPKTSRLTAKGGRIRTALGYHPQLVAERPNELSLFEKMLPETRYVGEVGLDGGKEFSDSKIDQAKIFGAILKLCSKNGSKILSIHSRHAASAVLDQIEKYPDCGVPILHWFTGTKGELQRAIGMGCWFSVGAPMLRSKKGQEALKLMPRDRILTETDAPFASKDIQGSLVTAMNGMAAIWGVEHGEVDSLLKSNLNTLVA